MHEDAIKEGRIYQFGFVVSDLDEAIRSYARTLNLGAWIILENVKYERMLYHGEECRAKTRVALSSSGNMTYELIQPLDEMPSVFNEGLNGTRSLGFHHFGSVVPSIENAIADYAAQGFSLAMDIRAAGGIRAAFIDTRTALPGMMELVEMSGAVMEFLRLPYDIARDFDATGPLIKRY